ncbi:hypothetical protein [Novosphingobium gossypii]|uniref:hypothetical protein n=1 Tax=Novosphingobium gossypii TaxID=1604774 RepID=UPI003D25D83E
MRKLILRPDLRTLQVVSAEVLTHTDVTGCKVVEVADDFDPATALVNWTSLTIGVDLTIIDTRLAGSVKREAERRKMQTFSAGNAKAQEYVQKGKEAAASATLTAAVLNALSVTNAAAQYPMAHAERTITGETLSAVLARYRASKAASDAELARLSAIEWKAVQTIKAATTPAAKQAAFSSINWNQTV